MTDLPSRTICLLLYYVNTHEWGKDEEVMTTGVAGGLLKPHRGSVTCTP